MTIKSSLVESCDFSLGQIVLATGHADVHRDSHSYSISITDSSGVRHESVARLSGNSLDFCIDAKLLPITKFEVENSTLSRLILSVDALFPLTDREFESQFKSQRDRSGDPLVDYFVASQISRWFRGKPGYRVSAAVVAAYKSIEILSDPHLVRAEEQLNECLMRLPEVPLNRSTRDNREHLQISVLCALFHVHLAQGKARHFIRTLNGIWTLLDAKEFSSFFNITYNASISLRLLSTLLKFSGNTRESRIVARLSFDLFKLGVQDADENLTHFKELKYSHGNTYDAMRTSRRVKELSEESLSRTLHSCVRVSPDSHPESFNRMLSTFLQAAKILRDEDNSFSDA